MKPFAWSATYQGHTSFTQDEQLGEVGWPSLGAAVTRLYAEPNIRNGTAGTLAGLADNFLALSKGPCVESPYREICEQSAAKLESISKELWQ